MDEQGGRAACSYEPNFTAADINQPAHAGGEHPVVFDDPVQLIADPFDERRGSCQKPVIPIPQGTDVHSIEGGSKSMSGYVSQEETVVILIELPDSAVVATHDIVGDIVRGETDAGIVGQIVLHGDNLDGLRLLQVLKGERNVTERFHSTHDLTGCIAKRGNRRLHRYPLPIPSLGEEQRAFTAIAGNNRTMQWAAFLAAHAVAILIHMAKNVVEAAVPHDVLGFPAGNPLGCLVPIRNLAIQVGHVDSIAQGVQDLITVDFQ